MRSMSRNAQDQGGFALHGSIYQHAQPFSVYIVVVFD